MVTPADDDDDGNRQVASRLARAAARCPALLAGVDRERVQLSFFTSASPACIDHVVPPDESPSQRFARLYDAAVASFAEMVHHEPAVLARAAEPGEEMHDVPFGPGGATLRVAQVNTVCTTELVAPRAIVPWKTTSQKQKQQQQRSAPMVLAPLALERYLHNLRMVKQTRRAPPMEDDGGDGARRRGRRHRRKKQQPAADGDTLAVVSVVEPPPKPKSAPRHGRASYYQDTYRLKYCGNASHGIVAGDALIQETSLANNVRSVLMLCVTCELLSAAMGARVEIAHRTCVNKVYSAHLGREIDFAAFIAANPKLATLKERRRKHRPFSTVVLDVPLGDAAANPQQPPQQSPRKRKKQRKLVCLLLPKGSAICAGVQDDDELKCAVSCLYESIARSRQKRPRPWT